MDPLVSTDWLAEHLDDPDLRVYETSVFLHRAADGTVQPRPGLAEWREGHIPGSGFIDLLTELSDVDAELWFTAPAPERLAATLGSLGVTDGTRVVFYDRLANMWATRAWWLLRSIGFDDAAVLDGGVRAWLADGRALTDAPAPVHEPGRLTVDPRPGSFVGADAVRQAMADGSTCILNALSEAQHRGDDLTYGRPGHIPGASNVAAVDLVDPETHRYRPLDDLRAEFDAAGADGRVIAYCGGGIAATSDAFVLTLLGHDDIAVYDGSLRDWIARDLPLEVGT